MRNPTYSREEILNLPIKSIVEGWAVGSDMLFLTVEVEPYKFETITIVLKGL